MTIGPKVKLRFTSITPTGKKSMKYQIYKRPPEIRITFEDWKDLNGEPIVRSFRRTGPDEYTELPERKIQSPEDKGLVKPVKSLIIKP